MKLSELVTMITKKIVDSLPKPAWAPTPMKFRLNKDFDLPDTPVWAGYLSGRIHKKTGLPVPSERPFWRASYVGDRSIYIPHQSKRECARRRRQLEQGVIHG